MSAAGIASRTLRCLEDQPLYQLAKLKLGHMLHGTSADTEDMDAGIGVALAVLPLPGAFLSLLLFNKYGSLLRVLRGQIKFDPNAASLPDEYLFIVLAMVVSGGVALWKWDSLFLDRRDTVNIVPLPVHTREIFVASLLAIILFAIIFCIDGNAGSAVLFPVVVSASQESLLFFGKIALGHAVAVLCASGFSFATVFATAGLFMAVLPTRAFQAISLYVRGCLAVALLLLLSTAFTVSGYIASGDLPKHPGVRYLPQVWFLGVCQSARGAADATFRHFAYVGLLALLLISLVGAMAYAVAYKRHFSRMAEMPTRHTGRPLWGLSSVIGRILDRTILRTSFERASFRFVVRTLIRSDRHRAAVAVFTAIGLVAAVQFLKWGSADLQGPLTAQFAAPLILLYCYILGVRNAFDIPVELNANWVFRFLLAPTLDECAMFAAKATFLLVVPMILLIAVMFSIRWGLLSGLLEGIVVTALSLTLILALVLSFRKLPFTCSRAGFQQNGIFKVLLFVLGSLAFSMLPASIQHWARFNLSRLLVLALPLGLIWWAIYEGRSGQMDIDRQIIFHDQVDDQIELLNLNS